MYDFQYEDLFFWLVDSFRMKQSLLKKSDVEPRNLSAFLHQNYLEFFTSIEDIVNLSDYVSLSDRFQSIYVS
jgi:hypothetical protein